MSQIIPLPAPLGAAHDPPPRPQARVAPGKRRMAASGQEPDEQADQRLEIQETEQAGVFVYTVIDRATGRILSQIPRETVAELAKENTYGPGQVIKTTA